MFKQIAIYQEELNQSVVSRWEEYIVLAVRYGINEVFSTIHLPEVDKITQIEAIEKMNEIIKNYDNLAFCVDIGCSYPRGPVYQGVVTLEEHRNKTLEEVLLDCAYALNAKGIMLADEYFNEDEFRILSNVINKENLTVKIKLEVGINDD